MDKDFLIRIFVWIVLSVGFWVYECGKVCLVNGDCACIQEKARATR